MSRPKAYIVASGTATPPLLPTQRVLEVVRPVLEGIGYDEKVIDKFEKICLLTKIRTRAVGLAHFHHGYETENIEFCGRPIGEIPESQITEGNLKFTPQQRNAAWVEIAEYLSLEAAKKALSNWTDGSAADITHVLTTTASGWKEPGIAAHLIHSLGLGLDTQKAELNFNGCFCSMTCLRLAKDIVRAADEGEKRAVLVVGVEVASSQADYEALLSDMVTMSLFSDGSGAFIVSNFAPDNAWEISGAGMSIIPDSGHLLGMTPVSPLNETSRNSYRMTLDPRVPMHLEAYFAKGLGKDLLEKLVDSAKPVEDRPALAVHPGGPRILDAVFNPLTQDFKFDKNCLEDSYDTLFSYGNLGSTAILFVLDKVLNSTTKNEAISFAFGPGVTVEWGKFTRASN